jgi:hypothetical protein
MFTSYTQGSAEMKRLGYFLMGFILLGTVLSCFDGAEADTLVMSLQTKLKDLGYDPGPLDGAWGAKTKEALKKYQVENNLTATGEIDAPTREQLALPTPAQQPSAVSDSIPQLNWSKDMMPEVKQASDAAATDPVAALMIYKTLLDKEKDGPTTAQKKWLKIEISTIKPRAAEILQRDYSAAAQANDLREMYMIKNVADEIEKNLVGDSAKIATCKSELFAGTDGGRLIWQITDVKASYIEGVFTKGGDFPGSTKTTLTPAPNCTLVRVSATIQNSGGGADKSYVSWGFSMVKRIMIKSLSALPKADTRWYDDSMVALVSPGGDMLSPLYTLEPSTFAVDIARPDGSGTRICTPEAIEKDKSVNGEWIFSIPKDIKGMRLWILGSQLAPMTITAASASN